MSSINKVILLGRLGKDPEAKTINGDLKVVNFSIATSESWNDKSGNKQEKTEWHRCQAWRGLADVIEKYVKKGDLIYVEGKITTRSWDKDGVKQYATEIVVHEMVMCGGKRDGGSAGNSDGFGGTPNAPEDDLPF